MKYLLLVALSLFVGFMIGSNQNQDDEIYFTTGGTRVYYSHFNQYPSRVYEFINSEISISISEFCNDTFVDKSKFFVIPMPNGYSISHVQNLEKTKELDEINQKVYKWVDERLTILNEIFGDYERAD